MKTFFFSLAVALFLLFANTAQAADAESLLRGQMIAKEKCSACHTLSTRGASPNPKSPPFRDLPKRFPLQHLEEALAEGISVGHGGPEMPEYEFEPEEIDDLLGYITHLSKQARRTKTK